MRLILILALALLAGCAKKPNPEPVAEPERHTTEYDQNETILDLGDLAETRVPESAIYFPINSDQIDPLVGWSIMGLVDYLRLTKHQIHLVGHACPLGEDGYNYDLGMRRARAVEMKLISEGISPERITVASLGESSPVTMDPKRYGLNRRVEYSFQEKDK